MKEEAKIKSVIPLAIFLSIIALMLYGFLVSCCTPVRLSQISSHEYKEAKIITATIVWIDSVKRLDVLGSYRYVSVIYWEDSENIKWVSYSTWPCPFKIGQWMPLLTKR